MVGTILKNSGQNTLEICLAIIIGIMLLLGAVSTWNWFNKSMAERFDAYKTTRHIAITTAMGRQVNYTPEKLDIFKLTSSVNPGGANEIPDLRGDPALQHCYDEFDQRLNQSQVLLNESTQATEQAGELMTEFVNLKCKLGNFTVVSFPHTYRYDGWLFYGDYNKFYQSSFKDIKRQFDLRSGCCLYYNEVLRQVSSYDIYVYMINPGTGLEEQSEAKAREADAKREQSEDLQKNSARLLIECLGGTPPPPNPCEEDCYNDYGRLAEQRNNETMAACFGGNFELCNQLGNETAILQQRYDDCLTNCTL